MKENYQCSMKNDKSTVHVYELINSLILFSVCDCDVFNLLKDFWTEPLQVGTTGLGVVMNLVPLPAMMEHVVDFA